MVAPLISSVFLMILELASSESLHWATAIDWLNMIDTWFWVLTNHRKLLSLILVLMFVVTHRVVA